MRTATPWLALLVGSTLCACAADPQEESEADAELAGTGVWHELAMVKPLQSSFNLQGSAAGSTYVGQYVRIGIPQSCGPTAIEGIDLYDARGIRALTGRFTTRTRFDVSPPPEGVHIYVTLEKAAKVASFQIRGHASYLGTCAISVALNDTETAIIPPIVPPPLPLESKDPTPGECEAVKNKIGTLYPDQIEKSEVRPTSDGASCSVYVQFKRWQFYRYFKLAYGMRPTLFPYVRPTGEIDVNVIATFLRF